MKMIVKFYLPEDLGFFPIYLGNAELCRLQEEIDRQNGYIHHQLFLVEDGEGFLEIGGSAHYIKKQDMFYISKDTPHIYYGITDDFKTSYVTFFGDGVDKIKSYYGIGTYGIYRNKSTSGFKKHLDEIMSYAKYSGELAPLCALTMSAVIDFFESVCRETQSPIEAVYKMIETNYTEMLTLDDLTKAYPYSKSKLCSDFKKKYKMTVFEMILDMRLRKANNMIASNPNVGNQRIADECGFRDVSYFCRMYKRKYGISPKGQDLQK